VPAVGPTTFSLQRAGPSLNNSFINVCYVIGTRMWLIADHLTTIWSLNNPNINSLQDTILVINAQPTYSQTSNTSLTFYQVCFHKIIFIKHSEWRLPLRLRPLILRRSQLQWKPTKSHLQPLSGT
jgi:hypothetical protein